MHRVQPGDHRHRIFDIISRSGATVDLLIVERRRCLGYNGGRLERVPTPEE